ncbi:MAG: hypothetical protein ACK4IK_05780 [Bacteroidia bacterium]
MAISQPSFTIPVAECTGDVTITFSNGNILKFICQEKTLDNPIRAIPFINNFQFPQPKNYNQNSYDLIWEDEFNSGILDGKKWKRDIGDHFGLQNNGNNGPNNLAYEAAIDERPHLFEISNGILKLKMRYHEQMANVFDYPKNCSNTIPLEDCILPDGIVNQRLFKYETARLESIQNIKHGYL